MAQCQSCKMKRISFTCLSCVDIASASSKIGLQNVNSGIENARLRLGDFIDSSGLVFGLEEEISKKEECIRECKGRITHLANLVSLVRSACETIHSRNVECDLLLKSRQRQTVSGDDFSFAMYMNDQQKYEKRLNSFHPYRRLRSISDRLVEERRQKCLRLFSLFQFRTVNVDSSCSLVADFCYEENNSLLLVQFVVPLLILLGVVLDVPLPFPLSFGTLVSSPCLPSFPVPQVLHAFKRTLVRPTPEETSYVLLIEDLRFIASIAQGFPLSSIPETADPIALLSLIILGRGAQGSSPSSSFRKSPVIEQSVTEGGEWTLLDQL